MFANRFKKPGILVFGLAMLLLGLPAQAGGWLGVAITEEIENEQGGALITQVVDDSPADEAGIRKGDIIVRVDGRTTRGPISLTRQIDEKQPGDSVSLTVIREGREQTIEVKIGERRHASHGQNYSFDFDHDFEGLEDLGERMGELGERLGEMFDCDDGHCVFNCEDDDCDFSFQHEIVECDGDDCPDFHFNRRGNRPLLGVQISESTPELLRHLGSSDGSGVLVSKVIPGTPAVAAGVEVGDVIVSIGGTRIDNVDDIRRGLAGNEGRTFDLEVIRNKAPRRLEVTLPDAPDATEKDHRPAMQKRAGEKT